MEFPDYLNSIPSTPITEAVAELYSAVFETATGTKRNKVPLGNKWVSVPDYIDWYMENDVVPDVNGMLSDYGMSIEYVPDYDFGRQPWLGTMARSQQVDAKVAPVAINKDAYDKYFTKLDWDAEQLEMQIRGTVWHEVGHLFDDILTDMGIEFTDEEDFAECFGEYMMSDCHSRKVKDLGWVFDAVNLVADTDEEYDKAIAKFNQIAKRQGF